MTEDYQPTKKEVFGEMVNGVRQYISGDNLRTIGTKLKHTGKHFLGMATAISIFPYIFPTTVRAVKEIITSSSVEPKFDATHNVGFSAGLVGGLGLYVAQGWGYSYAVENNHPEALLIPVVTNVASGVYEVGRSMYENARQRVIEKNKTEGLEAKMQE